MRNPQVLTEHGMQFDFFHSGTNIMNRDKMISTGIGEGCSVFMLGYPMNLVGRAKHYVIARRGTIARIKDFFERVNDIFLVDGFVQNGNSGSPVIADGIPLTARQTTSAGSTALIGVASRHIRYLHEELVERSSGKEEFLTFYENTGLTEVIPAHYVMETVEACFNEGIAIKDETIDQNDTQNRNYWARITGRLKAFWRPQDKVVCRCIFEGLKSTCKLCDKHPIYKVFTLENLTSQKTMWVGRKCVFNCIIALREIGIQATMLFPSKYTIYANRFNERWPGTAGIITNFDNDLDPEIADQEDYLKPLRGDEQYIFNTHKKKAYLRT